MQKKFIQTLQRYRLPLFIGLIHGAIAANFDSLFENETMRAHITWAAIGFISGFLISTLILKTTVFFTKAYKYLSQFFTLLTTAIFSQFFVCPFFATVFIPWAETNHHVVCCETPLDYGAENYESIKFTMSDGIVLSGWYVPPKKNANSIIILIHGRNNDRRGTKEWAKYLITDGYGIFMYDQRGNGESTGEMDFTSDMSTDLITLIDKINQKTNVKKIGVVGLSMGAHTAINALDIDQTKFSAVWLDGLYPQAARDLPGSSSFKEWFLTRIDNQLARIVKLRTGEKISVRRPITDILPSIKNTKIVLVAGGLEENEGPANRHYATLNNEHIHSWIIPDGHHLTGPYNNSAEYRPRLIKFFDEAFKEKSVLKN